MAARRISAGTALRATSFALDVAVPRVIISGAPASGKGTQCELIVANFGIPHLSTGDMLRAAVKAGSPLGKEAKNFMDNGKLVPDSLVIGLVKNRLGDDDCKTKGWLLDGFPRTAEQANALQSAGIIANKFILLNVLIERVVGRRTDPVTGKIYHVKFNPAPSAEIAARCTQRSDDTEEKVKTRLAAYHSNLQGILGFYKDIVVNVDGNRNKDAIYADIDKVLKA